MKKSPSKQTLNAEQLAGAEIVAAYAHPESGRTVARHLDGEAYTVTGLHAGKAEKLKSENAEKLPKTAEPKKQA